MLKDEIITAMHRYLDERCIYGYLIDKVDISDRINTGKVSFRILDVKGIGVGDCKVILNATLVNGDVKSSEVNFTTISPIARATITETWENCTEYITNTYGSASNSQTIAEFCQNFCTRMLDFDILGCLEIHRYSETRYFFEFYVVKCHDQRCMLSWDAEWDITKEWRPGTYGIEDTKDIDEDTIRYINESCKAVAEEMYGIKIRN